MGEGAVRGWEGPRWRLLFVCGLAMAFSLLIAGRLFQVQVLRHDYYLSLARQEHWQKESIPARRGTIRASDGQPLAMSVDFESLYANTWQLEDPARAARLLAPILGEPVDKLEARLTLRQEAPVLVKAFLPAEIADRVRGLRLRDIYLKPEPHRLYPEGDLAAQVVGFVGRDHQGLAGLEASQDELLAGKAGILWAERDTGGDEISLGRRQYQPPEDGQDLVLTIDRVIQRVVEKELAAAVAKQRATGGTVIVMAPRSGAILAMASRPTFDPRDAQLLDPARKELYRNPAVNDLYEPGSVFKVVTYAASLEEGLIGPNSPINDPGLFRYGGMVVRNWDGKAYGTMAAKDALKYSNNVAAATLSTRLGPDTFYRYVRAFGFGQPTGIELGGETPGMVRTNADGQVWSPSDLATNAFGQGLGATPLQMLTAAAAVANEGLLMKPRLIQEMVGTQGRRASLPQGVRRVISPATARTLTEMLVYVVENVPGTPAKIPGYRVAGKTGTAEIPTGQGYAQNATIASFIGYAPADDPAFIVLVKIDRPQDSPWGGEVAAPLFKTIAVQLLAYLRLPPGGGDKLS